MVLQPRMHCVMFLFHYNLAFIELDSLSASHAPVATELQGLQNRIDPIFYVLRQVLEAFPLKICIKYVFIVLFCNYL